MKYTVQANDEEYAVATKYGVSVGNLRKANEKLPQPYLVEGRVIEVPTDAPATSTSYSSNYSTSSYASKSSDDKADDKE
ncbi:LysM peptidoglycan-binding domain-containing protein [Apilactobacillus kunkeei]|uniref:LysM peptidoglycan-binding domain-containing protein n=1 Tax=Apilactobacillus kunkeei TaxID=148814 RepID=UPI00112C127E|nr:LysM peptidoglycan-binding domain-containing protein [Apilactobacillus kunkeei]TPR53159.1 LysM peptidoglycan-binding domain-containing protein [Apilactobacillus kunkeei]CAI2654220.1 hypothetical protein AKUH4B504J_05240 [Apilactobacillus kunkeei]